MLRLDRSVTLRRAVRNAAAMPALAFALTACSAGPASTHGRFVAVHNAFEAIGLSQVGHITEGSLAENNSVRFPMDLEAQCYTFVAFGGDGARDVDLIITDAQNNRVATDTSRDQQATVQYCPTSRGRYTLTLRMASGSGTFTLSSWRGTAHGVGNAAEASSDGPGGAGSCQQPIPIAIGQTVTGDTRHGHNNASGSCAEGEAPEMVYVLQVPRRQQITVAAEQDYDGVLYLRTNCDDPQSQPDGACNDDDGDTSHSRVVSVLEPGTYYIFEDGYAEHSGSYTLTVTASDVPQPSDVCQSAPALTPGTALSGQTNNEPNVFQAACANGARGPDHVYRLDVPEESRLQITQESDYDGALYVRRACADQSSEIACNDDAEDTQHSRINTVVPQGTYYVFSDAFTAQAAGSYTIEADIVPLAGGTGVTGDTCADAIALTPGQPVEGNTFAARDDVHSPCGAQSDGYDIVYRLDVQHRSHVRLWFDSADLGANAVIYLTRNCAAAATSVPSGAPAGGANAQNAAIACRAGALTIDQALDATLDRGQYFVVVDSAQARAFGKFKLQARVEDMAALDHACRQAPALRSGQTVTGTTSGDDRFQSTCAGGSRSPENLYRLVLHRRSMVRLALTATSQNYDPSIYIRAVCTDATTERACNDDAPDQRHSLIETTLDAGTYTVFVDGYSNRNSGQYSLEVTVSAP